MAAMEPEISGLLKQAREAKRISLDEASRATKLSVKMILALEGEEAAKLPGEIYVKAFVKTYANFLGIADQAAEQYEKSRARIPQAPPQWKPQTSVTAAADRALHWKKTARIGAMAAGVLAALVLALSLLWGGAKRQPAPAPADAPSAAISVIAQQAAPKPPATVQQAQPAVIQPLQQPKPVLAPKANPPAAYAAKDGLSLEVVALDRVWVRVKADNLLLFEGTMERNSRETWSAQREFLLKLGSAGAVRMLLNDKELNKVGNKGEVKTVVINKDGVVKTR